ncbi:polysaccharide biosynthesis C-terminal domain-containing protein [Mucilaginibacter sp. R-33]|uniref:polysaccharide biosynthesis C-terminal domain-containing protein n=1 Tax=unclassified Mucilaginibacter TaxID=2617802 RepID=UPI003CF08CA9
MSTFKKIISGSMWGMLAKILDAIAKFVTIPMLIGFYGKADYGLIALAFSLNAYLRLMDLGMTTGAVRFFSIWFANDEKEKVVKVAQSSLVFYGVIGLINAIIFIITGYYSDHFFHLPPSQTTVFAWMMYILAASTIFNWMSFVVRQLLTACGELGWINATLAISSIFNFITAFVAIKLKISLPVYFLLYILSTVIVIPLNTIRLTKTNIKIGRLLTPKWDGKAFKEILGYSMGIFIMSIFTYSADSLRPIVLGIFTTKGTQILTDYRIVQTIIILVNTLGGVFFQVLLPITSRSLALNEKKKIEELIYTGTKYISIFSSIMIFVLMVNSTIILHLYVGKEYEHLSLWLIIGLITQLLQMHLTPIASLVLSTGKTKFLIYSSGFSCIASLVLTAILTANYGMGAAMVGYCGYMVVQISFYYFYYVPKILDLSSVKIFFKSFLPAVIIGIVPYVLIHLMDNMIHTRSLPVLLIINTIVMIVVFFTLCTAFIVKPAELKVLWKKLV